MDCDFSPSSPHLLPNGLFSPQNRISFELLALSGLLGFSTFKGGKMLIFQGFANSRIVREFPPFSFKVRIATLTRNQFGSNATWVRIPPSAPRTAPCGVLLFIFAANYAKGCKVGFEQPVPGALRPAGQKCPGGAFLGRGRVRASAPRAAPCGVLLFIFAANYARAARWDSNSPCPALCVPPGCNSPADCCKGAGESHRLHQVSLLNSTLGSDFLLLCKIPKLFL